MSMLPDKGFADWMAQQQAQMPPRQNGSAPRPWTPMHAMPAPKTARDTPVAAPPGYENAGINWVHSDMTGGKGQAGGPWSWGSLSQRLGRPRPQGGMPAGGMSGNLGGGGQARPGGQFTSSFAAFGQGQPQTSYAAFGGGMGGFQRMGPVKVNPFAGRQMKMGGAQ